MIGWVYTTKISYAVFGAKDIHFHSLTRVMLNYPEEIFKSNFYHVHDVGQLLAILVP